MAWCLFSLFRRHSALGCQRLFKDFRLSHFPNWPTTFLRLSWRIRAPFTIFLFENLETFKNVLFE
jgi:hypothetical protein